MLASAQGCGTCGFRQSRARAACRRAHVLLACMSPPSAEGVFKMLAEHRARARRAGRLRRHPRVLHIMTTPKRTSAARGRATWCPNLSTKHSRRHVTERDFEHFDLLRDGRAELTAQHARLRVCLSCREPSAAVARVHAAGGTRRRAQPYYGASNGFEQYRSEEGRRRPAAPPRPAARRRRPNPVPACEPKAPLQGGQRAAEAFSG